MLQTQALELLQSRDRIPVLPESLSLYRSQVQIEENRKNGKRPKIAAHPTYMLEIVSDFDTTAESAPTQTSDVEALSPKSRTWEMAKNMLCELVAAGKKIYRYGPRIERRVHVNNILDQYTTAFQQYCKYIQ